MNIKFFALLFFIFAGVSFCMIKTNQQVIENIPSTQQEDLSWMNPKLEVRQSSLHGQGLHAKEKLYKNETLVLLGGAILTFKQVLDLPEHARRYVTQIGDGLVIWNSRHGTQPVATDFINHSCNPNAGIKGQIALVAMRDIEAGEEITFDYAMVLSEFIGMENYILCNCGTSYCRKIVTQDDWKIPELQQRYKGYFSTYLQEKM